jgi:hypothetical protein
MAGYIPLTSNSHLLLAFCASISIQQVTLKGMNKSLIATSFVFPKTNADTITNKKLRVVNNCVKFQFDTTPNG